MKIRVKRAAFAVCVFAVAASQAWGQTTTNYTYDALGRLVTSKSSASTLQTTYAYDPADNRSQVTVAAPATNGVSCATASSNIQAYQSGNITTTFNLLSQCSDSTSGATMSLSSWGVSGVGSATLTSSSPPTLSVTLPIGNTVISYTAVDNVGGSSSGTFTFNRTS